jgi:hypothetical protein
MSAPIILVPGFWLGAWAWDEVAEKLGADGHGVTALTLPGLESADADRSSILSGIPELAIALGSHQLDPTYIWRADDPLQS